MSRQKLDTLAWHYLDAIDQRGGCTKHVTDKCRNIFHGLGSFGNYSHRPVLSLTDVIRVISACRSISSCLTEAIVTAATWMNLHFTIVSVCA